MDVATYERETHEASYYETSNSNPKCYGCLLLESGEGGENQLAHMDPGGCLYHEFSDFEWETETNSQNTSNESDKTPKIINCIICCESQKNSLDGFICDMCQTKEDREREVRYQSFVADLYGCSK